MPIGLESVSYRFGSWSGRPASEASGSAFSSVPADSVDHAFILFGAFAGGFVSGLAGFGTGLIALGIWLYVLAPAVAACLVVICSVVSQLQTIPLIWHAIDRRIVAPFLIGGLAGVPFGAALVVDLDPSWFRLIVGIVLVVFSAVMLRGGLRRPIAANLPAVDALIGFGGGVLGGLTGLSGPLPTMWATMRAWDKDRRRSVFQSFNLTILLATLLAYAIHGVLTADLWPLVLQALPGTLLGSWLGARVYRRLPEAPARFVVLVVLACSGVTLIVTAALQSFR